MWKLATLHCAIEVLRGVVIVRSQLLRLGRRASLLWENLMSDLIYGARGLLLHRGCDRLSRGDELVYRIW
jgi:hypothetical protein